MLERFNAVAKAKSRENRVVEAESGKISDYFEQNVFTAAKMKQYLPKQTFDKLKELEEEGGKIDKDTANQVAIALKSWAMERGATHYTHWFQPLTGLTAEKHETFFRKDISGENIESFDGSHLIQGEPDGSRLPSGGLRATHEARGYTVWDPTSPAFIIATGDTGKTLCIPTIFISYSGQAMGHKAPLLKSLQYLEKSAVNVLQFFDRSATKVFATLGWEQEFFVIDEALYYARPDLVVCGRTLTGHGPSRGQQLDDHYFGSIPERVYAFLVELETEAYKLGISISTRHKEVAPGQYELTPIYDEANKAIDQNQLLMDLMGRIGTRHRFKVLLHEKPFEALNGSGKHSNWSLHSGKNINLFSPGRTPKKNLQFLTFFINFIKAVNDHNDLLRAAISSAGNDLRLGHNEAPPTIFSLFIGSTLTDILKDLSQKVKHGKMDDYEKMDLKLQLHNKLPEILLDNTDRNRTSPIAFTGDKIEIRAVGAAANCSFPITILNTIVAHQLDAFHQEVKSLIDGGEKKDGAIFRVLRRYIQDSERVLFEGDNYSEEWVKEAAKRKLSNVKSTAYALDFLNTKEAKAVLIESGVFSEHELEARYEVFMGTYQMKLQIEARMLGQLATAYVVPASVTYLNKLIENVKGMHDIGMGDEENVKAVKRLIKYINQRISIISNSVVDMIEARKKINKVTDVSKRAKAYNDEIKPYFEVIRHNMDKLELVVDDGLWPLPKYRELLFVK